MSTIAEHYSTLRSVATAFRCWYMGEIAEANAELAGLELTEYVVASMTLMEVMVGELADRTGTPVNELVESVVARCIAGMEER